ncbi:MAG: protein phosphatase 2C domain-containing protein [Pseudomonadota bacterium]
MAMFEVIETINNPGAPGKTGDDRYGFDASAGAAWVLDGATDVTDLRPFPKAESGAAWIAQTLSELLAASPWPEDEPKDYVSRILKQALARAEKESALPLGSLPGEAWPIAAGMWMRRGEDNRTDFAWLGDCVALIRPTGQRADIIGSLEKAEAETDVAKQLMALSEAERWDALRLARRDAYDAKAAIFGLRPEAADALNTSVRTLPVESDIVLMTDGLFRLITPYRTHDADSLMALIEQSGVSGAVAALRAMEGDDGDNAALGRIKRSDDACAVWLKLRE